MVLYRPTKTFTDEQVIKYREKYKNREIGQMQIVKEIGCSRATVRHMLNGINYKHLGGAVVEKFKPGGKLKHSEEFCNKMRTLRQEGISLNKIALILNVPKQTVYNRTKNYIRG